MQESRRERRTLTCCLVDGTRIFARKERILIWGKVREGEEKTPGPLNFPPSPLLSIEPMEIEPVWEFPHEMQQTCRLSSPVPRRMVREWLGSSENRYQYCLDILAEGILHPLLVSTQNGFLMGRDGMWRPSSSPSPDFVGWSGGEMRKIPNSIPQYIFVCPRIWDGMRVPWLLYDASWRARAEDVSIIEIEYIRVTVDFYVETCPWKLLCGGRSCETLFCSGIVVRSLVLSFAFSFRYRWYCANSLSNLAIVLSHYFAECIDHGLLHFLTRFGFSATTDPQTFWMSTRLSRRMDFSCCWRGSGLVKPSAVAIQWMLIRRCWRSQWLWTSTCFSCFLNMGSFRWRMVTVCLLSQRIRASSKSRPMSAKRRFHQR